MNETVHNSTNNSAEDALGSEMGDPTDGHVMSVDSVPNVSMMQSTVLTDLQLIYMLQQQQQQQGGAGEGAMMLSSSSLPLLMSSCQVMALHPSVSQQFVSSSSTGTSPSSLARSPLLVQDGGSIVWHHPAATDDQLSDNFDDDHHQGTSFSQHSQGNGGLSQQQTASPVVSRNALQVTSHPQLLTINGALAAYPGYSVVNAASTVVPHSSGGFVASAAPSKIVVAAPPKASLAAPKKPLTPYMKFSKSIWQHVKNANPSLSVCEVGASIGRLWREMIDTEKQKYNDEFQREKAVYEVELQTYLRATGLQVSDLTKSKKKDTRDRSKANAAATASAMPNQNYVKTVMALPLSNSNAVSLSSEGVPRLPHISQMWSGHSVTHQPQTISQLQNVLKTACNPFDGARLKIADVNNQSLQEHGAHSSPGGAALLSSELPSGMSWTWMKAVDPVTNNDPSRSSFSLDPLNTSQSAYVPQDQGPIAIATPANQQPVMEFYSASDTLEPGEVVVEGLQQSTFLAKVSSSPQNGSCIASAHNMYNSYAVNPWNRYKMATGPKPVEAIFDREQILHTELVHLRGSLSEKTKEVEQLSKELEVAYELIGKLQQQDNPPPPPSQSHPEESVDGSLQPDGKPESEVIQSDTRDQGTCGHSAFEEEEDSKRESNRGVDMTSTGLSEENHFTSTAPCRIDDSLSTGMMQGTGEENSDRNDPTTADNSSVADPNLAPNHQTPMGTTRSDYSMPARGFQSATENAETTTEQRVVVAQFSDQRNVVLLQFESNMQREEQPNRELQMEDSETVARNRQEEISEEMPTTSRFAGDDLKESGENGEGEMV